MVIVWLLSALPVLSFWSVFAAVPASVPVFSSVGVPLVRVSTPFVVATMVSPTSMSASACCSRPAHSLIWFCVRAVRMVARVLCWLRVVAKVPVVMLV